MVVVMEGGGDDGVVVVVVMMVGGGGNNKEDCPYTVQWLTSLVPSGVITFCFLFGCKRTVSITVQVVIFSKVVFILGFRF